MNILLNTLAILAVMIIAFNALVWAVVAVTVFKNPSQINHVKTSWHDIASLIGIAYLIAYWSN